MNEFSAAYEIIQTAKIAWRAIAVYNAWVSKRWAPVQRPVCRLIGAEINGKGFSELTPIVMKDERTRGLTDVSMSVIWPKHLCCAFILPIRAFGFRPWGPMLLLREGSLIERKKEEPALAVQVVQCTRAPGCHGGPWLSPRPPGVTGTPGCHGGPWVSRGPLAVVASQGPLAESESMININLISVCNQIIN